MDADDEKAADDIEAGWGVVDRCHRFLFSAWYPLCGQKKQSGRLYDPFSFIFWCFDAEFLACTFTDVYFCRSAWLV